MKSVRRKPRVRSYPDWRPPASSLWCTPLRRPGSRCRPWLTSPAPGAINAHAWTLARVGYEKTLDLRRLQDGPVRQRVQLQQGSANASTWPLAQVGNSRLSREPQITPVDTANRQLFTVKRHNTSRNTLKHPTPLKGAEAGTPRVRSDVSFSFREGRR